MWWSRISAQPFSLGPYELPRGARVIYSPYITHRRPELYAQPRRFLPERWRTIAPGPYEYIPFSAGPRACLGAGFALMELKVALALIVQRFRLTLRPGARVDYGGLMLSQPQPGLPMRIAAQDRRLAASPLRGTIAELVEPPAAGN
jgi:cytochrome P450